jgi:hypothetical protein
MYLVNVTFRRGSGGGGRGWGASLGGGGGEGKENRILVKNFPTLLLRGEDCLGQGIVQGKKTQGKADIWNRK